MLVKASDYSFQLCMYIRAQQTSRSDLRKNIKIQNIHLCSRPVDLQPRYRKYNFSYNGMTSTHKHSQNT